MHTARWLPLGLLLGCLTARADIVDPSIRGVDPQFAFAGVQDHPDHVFLVHVQDKGYRGPNVPFESRVIPIPGPEPFAPGFNRTVGKVAVLAVPKAAYDKLSEEQRQELSAESPGVLSCGIDTPRMIVRTFELDPAPAAYRVAIADGQLRVEPVKPGDRDSSVVPPFRSRRGWWALAVAASVAWLGFVVSRRLVRGTP